jgi:hypothetical protein
VENAFFFISHDIHRVKKCQRKSTRAFIIYINNYTGQQISKKIFVSVMNMLLIYLFASMKLEKGHKNNYLALVSKLCYHYDILRNRLKYYTERWIK